jgi:hypothetical protein
MMPKEEPYNLNICTLITDGSNHVLAYMGRKGGRSFMILINKEGIFRLKDLDGNQNCSKLLEKILERKVAK